MAPRIQTVLGDINPDQLGITLTHEHLAINFKHFYRVPPDQLKDQFNTLTIQNSGYLKQYPYSSMWNLSLNDEEAKKAVGHDVSEYKRFGGGTIVDNSCGGLERDVPFYKALSANTGVNIIAGTGYYIADLQSNSVLSKTNEDIYNHMLEELTVGCLEDTSVKAGFMGEIASVWPLRDFERKAIIAAGELQPQVGCGVSFHPHRDIEAPFEIIRLYLEAGGSADKVVMSHLDRTLLKDEDLLEFSKLGTYCQFDLFGVEVSYYQMRPDTDMPSDGQRLDKVKLLVDEGKADKILMSHDIHTKHRLTHFGGHGYSHIINNVLPRMKTKGIPERIIDQITIDNPARWLSIDN